MKAGRVYTDSQDEKIWSSLLYVGYVQEYTIDQCTVELVLELLSLRPKVEIFPQCHGDACPLIPCYIWMNVHCLLSRQVSTEFSGRKLYITLCWLIQRAVASFHSLSFLDFKGLWPSPAKSSMDLPILAQLNTMGWTWSDLGIKRHGPSCTFHHV